MTQPVDPTFTIRPAATSDECDQARALFTAYAAALNVDLTFQSLTTELATLPGAYSPPTGCLFLAYLNTDQDPVGCVGVRPGGSEGICEMKRLYVAPEGRGTGVGRGMAEAAIAEARNLGYVAIRLDTLPWMTSGIGLYRSLGFKEIEAYYHNPIQGALFFCLKL